MHARAAYVVPSNSSLLMPQYARSDHRVRGHAHRRDQGEAARGGGADHEQAGGRCVDLKRRGCVWWLLAFEADQRGLTDIAHPIQSHAPLHYVRH